MGKSTYEELIDIIRDEFSHSPDLVRKSDESFQVDILNAEQTICEMYGIEEQYHLRLREGVSEYLVRDRPPIESIDPSTGIVVVRAHKLSNKDYIELRWSNGRKRYYIYTIDNDSFSLRDFARIKSINVSVAPVVITTETKHPFKTGDSVLIENTNTVDGTFVVTVTSDTTFTIPVGAAIPYTGKHGVASKPAVSLYAQGGRIWQESEIPTQIGYFTFCQADRMIDFVGNFEMIALEDSQWSWTIPSVASEQRIATQRYVRFYPVPNIDRDVIIYGNLKITPRDYYHEPLSNPIHLDSEWDSAILSYVRSRVFAFLRDYNASRSELDEFRLQIRQALLRKPTDDRIKVVYE